MNVLVTGGAGFIGFHTVQALLTRGAQVTVIDRVKESERGELPSSVKVLEADILEDDLYDKLCGESFSAMIHLAAQTEREVAEDDPEKEIEESISGTIQMLTLAHKLNIKRFVYASSVNVYGNKKDLPVMENVQLSPFTAQAISTMTSEHFTKYFCQLWGLEYSILRYANVYGPGGKGVINQFIDQLFESQAPIIYGDGAQTRDFIHVEDVARANVAALDSPSGIFNISTNIETDINTIYAMVATHFGKTIHPVYAKAREEDVDRAFYENARAEEYLGWEPFFTVKEGIEQTIDYFRS
ncbi:NAD-dependent epimerase/dehydratase family protein [Thalassobacillus hwangdonensis]|uniref:NAD-dependent epimerase/dehydratase family protein n=1 Tax=Thalassobacillus hwangdonensis TaxID=546108 RepID=A0ABW3L1T0_9BACI